MQSDAVFVELRLRRGFSMGFWDKFGVRFYKIERVLHMIRDFGDKLRARSRAIVLILSEKTNAMARLSAVPRAALFSGAPPGVGTTVRFA